ncbi:MAG: hypothetical protein QM702_10875 [Rubrivivax sp.]
MGEFIVDNFKAEAMKVPFLRDIAAHRTRSRSSSNITFANLDPLSTYLGRPADVAQGGLPLGEYQRRQEQHRVAEIEALKDVPTSSSGRSGCTSTAISSPIPAGR